MDWNVPIGTFQDLQEINEEGTSLEGEDDVVHVGGWYWCC